MNNPLVSGNLELLYNGRKLSLTSIAKHLGISVHKVTYWMQKYGISRRSHSESAYLQANPDGDPFYINDPITLTDAYIKGIAIGIYMGEGNKVAPAVRVTNTDPMIIRIFRKFLLENCGLKQTKIHYSLICFQDSNLVTVRRYWSEQLEVKDTLFGKITQIPPQGKGTYRKKSLFGVCTLHVSNVKLKSWIMKEIKELKYFLSPDSSVVRTPTW